MFKDTTISSLRFLRESIRFYKEPLSFVMFLILVLNWIHPNVSFCFSMQNTEILLGSYSVILKKYQYKFLCRFSCPKFYISYWKLNSYYLPFKNQLLVGKMHKTTLCIHLNFIFHTSKQIQT